MNDRHRRVARLKKQMEKSSTKRQVSLSETCAIMGANLNRAIQGIGEIFEMFGKSLVRLGCSMQRKESTYLMRDLSREEWIALSHYIKGNLYIGGQNEGREERIELFQNAAVKIIRIGDVLEGELR